jgi:FixJ family two-component response regulator
VSIVVQEDIIPSTSVTPQAPQRRSILIVDDNQATARGLGYLFRDAGYEPATFHEGLSALEYARDHRPAAAVIDIHLPDISGLILSQRLRETLGSHAPIVVLSGDASMEVLNSLPHVGATYFFRKPVSGTMLLEHFRELLEQAGED